MPMYVGFSTQNVCQTKEIASSGADGGVGNLIKRPYIGRKFKLVDEQLVLQDLLNAFSIKQGDKVGQPGYGTTLWSFLFDPSTTELRSQIIDEVRRVASLDPRITIGTLQIYSHDNGVLMEMEISIEPFEQVQLVNYFFNKFENNVRILS